MKQEYSAGVIVYCIENDQNLFLLLHYVSGHWDFPKGHLEPGETNQQAAHRELKEETGLTVLLDPLFVEKLTYFFYNAHIQQKVYKTVTFFLGKANSKKVIISFEHKGFVWLPYNQALQQLTYKNAQVILQEAEKTLKNECVK